MSGRKTKNTIESIRKEFESKGAVLLTDEYVNCQQALRFKCSQCGKEHYISYHNYSIGRNPNLLCKDCMKSVSLLEIKKSFSRMGATLLSKEFVNVDVPLEIACASCGEPFTLSWANYKAGHNRRLLCPSCRSKQKTKEKIYGKCKVELITQENNGKQLYQRKLSEWENGFLYIPVYPGEFESEIFNSIIVVRNGSCQKIYARKCEVKQIENGKEFLKENHIQGYRHAEVTLGLFYQDQLLSVMSFGKPRFNQKYEYELIRLATKKGFEVVGGASKLFTYFKDVYQPKSVISYCDVRFCKPDPAQTVYSKLGFEFLYQTEPNYSYWSKDLKKSYSRMACQKHRLSGLIENFDPNLTEYQNMHNAGFIRIYDCGNYVFGWKK